MKLPDRVDEVVSLAKKRWLIGALKEKRWHKSRTAKLMQISRPTLDAWIRKYGLKKPKRNGERKA